MFEFENCEYDGPDLLFARSVTFSSVTGGLCHSDCQEGLACCASGFAILVAYYSILLQIIEVLCNDIDRFGKIKNAS